MLAGGWLGIVARSLQSLLASWLQLLLVAALLPTERERKRCLKEPTTPLVLEPYSKVTS